VNTRKFTIALASLVSLATFALLFGGLYDLAIRVGFHSWQAWLFPIAVDLAAMTFLVATLDRRISGKSHAFLWFAAAIAEAVSVLGQFLAHPATDAAPYAPWIASWPAISLLLVQHTLWIIAQDTLQVVEESATVAAKQELLEEIDAHQPTLLDRAVDAVLAAKENGRELTGATMAEILGLKKENGSPHLSEGRKILKRAQEAIDAG
jgi:hypothetical protein